MPAKAVKVYLSIPQRGGWRESCQSRHRSDLVVDDHQFDAATCEIRSLRGHDDVDVSPLNRAEKALQGHDQRD